MSQNIVTPTLIIVYNITFCDSLSTSISPEVVDILIYYSSNSSTSQTNPYPLSIGFLADYRSVMLRYFISYEEKQSKRLKWIWPTIYEYSLHYELTLHQKYVRHFHYQWCEPKKLLQSIKSLKVYYFHLIYSNSS